MLLLPKSRYFIRNHRDTNFVSKKQITFDAKKTEWEGVVGLEVHAQIQSTSKLFSGAETSYAGRVNTQVTFFDAAIPGTLPVLNKECVKKGILTALALNCSVQPVSWFDRKHYFYADLPAGYQITQQRAPFATNGELEFQVLPHTTSSKTYFKRSVIKQIQLEQDSGKSLHDVSHNMCFLDLNRAGNPLMELVFEPDLKDGEEAASLIKELILILKELKTCSCKMEEGAFRVDANVSVRPRGSHKLGVRSEVKNISSVRAIAKAVNYEIERQRQLCYLGEPVVNETRAWDADNDRTVVMRDKEVIQDYRFMPEPNLPPLKVSVTSEGSMDHDIINVSEIRNHIPLLPAYNRQMLVEKYNLSPVNSYRLVDEPVLYKSFLDIMEENKSRTPVKVCNMLIIDLLAVLNDREIEPSDYPINSVAFGELIDLLLEGTINRSTYLVVLTEIVNGNADKPRKYVEENNLYPIKDEKQLCEFCSIAIKENQGLVDIYNGKKHKKTIRQAYNDLLTAAVKHSNGRADIRLLMKSLEKMLRDQK